VVFTYINVFYIFFKYLHVDYHVPSCERMKLKSFHRDPRLTCWVFSWSILMRSKLFFFTIKFLAKLFFLNFCYKLSRTAVSESFIWEISFWKMNARSTWIDLWFRSSTLQVSGENMIWIVFEIRSFNVQVSVSSLFLWNVFKLSLTWCLNFR